jgi:hypothetical protein
MGGKERFRLRTASGTPTANDGNLARSARHAAILSLTILACFALEACGTKSLVPYSAETPPLVLLPATQAGIQDKRARFREIFCAVLESHASQILGYQPFKVSRAMPDVSSRHCNHGRVTAYANGSNVISTDGVPCSACFCWQGS